MQAICGYMATSRYHVAQQTRHYIILGSLVLPHLGVVFIKVLFKEISSLAASVWEVPHYYCGLLAISGPIEFVYLTNIIAQARYSHFKALTIQSQKCHPLT